MAIDSKIPEVSVLRGEVERTFGRPLQIHSDFEALREEIFERTRQHVSETTLERLWEYSTRGYEGVQRRTLDVLCGYIGVESWQKFTDNLKKTALSESAFFDEDTVNASSLAPGDRIRIGWHPDREIIIRYEGGDRFFTEESRNAKIQPGDTFSCLQFQLHAPLYLENLRDSAGAQRGVRYGVGLRNGITMLQLLPKDQA